MTFLFLYTNFVREMQLARNVSKEAGKETLHVRRHHEEFWKEPLKNKTRKPRN